MRTRRVLKLVALLYQVGNSVESKSVGVHVIQPVRQNLLHFAAHRWVLIIQVGHLVPEYTVVVLVTDRRLVPRILSPRALLSRKRFRPAIPIAIRTARIVQRGLKP